MAERAQMLRIKVKVVSLSLVSDRCIWEMKDKDSWILPRLARPEMTAFQEASVL